MSYQEDITACDLTPQERVRRYIPMRYTLVPREAPGLQNQYAMIILSFSRGIAGKINRWGFALLAAGVLAAGRPANAQLPQGLPQIPGLPKRQQPQSKVPPNYRPPAGMCRIWIDGVPANQHPAPTDCVTAVRNRPVNGTVIFGDESPKRGNEKTKKGKSKKDSDDSPES